MFFDAGLFTMTIDYDHDHFYRVQELAGFSLGKWFALSKLLSPTSI